LQSTLQFFDPPTWLLTLFPKLKIFVIGHHPTPSEETKQEEAGSQVNLKRFHRIDAPL